MEQGWPPEDLQALIISGMQSLSIMKLLLVTVHFMRMRRHIYGIVLPMHAVSPTRPSRLLVSPPVDVAQATFPALSIATAPTVPRSLPKIAFQTISCRSQSI